MTIVLVPLALPEALTLFLLLREADEDDERVRAALLAPTNIVYAAEDEGLVIGAAVIAWHPTECELLLLAVAPHQRRHGNGRQIVAALVEDVRKRGTSAIIVGTGNSSLITIKLYQKCGFRMDSIRRDYFAYIQPPISENGIPLRDMLVLRMDVTN